jgi:MoaA/NifB/PqqE/SkfB family radical SAM enzyme
VECNHFLYGVRNEDCRDQNLYMWNRNICYSGLRGICKGVNIFRAVEMNMPFYIPVENCPL